MAEEDEEVAESVRPSASAPEVLVVEDDRFNRRLYRDLLEAEGWRLRLMATADEALRSARESPPALIVMDIELPGINGLDATRILRDDPRTAGIPILIISAHAIGDQVKRVIAAGGSAFLRKPLMFPDFQETIHQLLR